MKFTKRSGVQLIAERINAQLVTSGFSFGGLVALFGGEIVGEWKRASDWRVDSLSLMMRNGWIEMGVAVATLIAGSAGVKREAEIDGVGLAWLSGRGTFRYDVLDSREAALRISQEIVSDLPAGLAWFEEKYGTSSLALERMTARDRNGCMAGTDIYIKIVDSLRSHAAASRFDAILIRRDDPL